MPRIFARIRILVKKLYHIGREYIYQDGSFITDYPVLIDATIEFRYML